MSSTSGLYEFHISFSVLFPPTEDYAVGNADISDRHDALLSEITIIAINMSPDPCVGTGQTGMGPASRPAACKPSAAPSTVCYCGRRQFTLCGQTSGIILTAAGPV